MDKLIDIEVLDKLVYVGDLLVCGGFQMERAPIALVQALARSGRSVELVSLPNPLPLVILLRAGAIERMHVSFNGLSLEDGFVIPPAYREAVESGQIEWRESDVYEIIQGLRAAQMGLPFMPAPALSDSQYTEANDYQLVEDPFSKDEVIAVPPIRPDIALLHVQQADRQGNLYIKDPLYDHLIVAASQHVMVSCEDLVEKVEEPTIAGIYVDHVIHLPGGAAPTGCLGYYQPDEETVSELIRG